MLAFILLLTTPKHLRKKMYYKLEDTYIAVLTPAPGRLVMFR
jgi:hypothetical protein